MSRGVGQVERGLPGQDVAGAVGVGVGGGRELVQVALSQSREAALLRGLGPGRVCLAVTLDVDTRQSGGGAPRGAGLARRKTDSEAMRLMAAPQRGDLGQPLAAQVVAQGGAQGVEGLVVVQDALALAHVSRHAPGLRACGPAPASSPRLRLFAPRPRPASTRSNPHRRAVATPSCLHLRRCPPVPGRARLPPPPRLRARTPSGCCSAPTWMKPSRSWRNPKGILLHTCWRNPVTHLLFQEGVCLLARHTESS